MYTTTIGAFADYYGILLHTPDCSTPLFLTTPTSNFYDSHGMSYKIECWYKLFTSDFTNSVCLYENPNAYDRFTQDIEHCKHYTEFVHPTLHEVMADIRAHYLVGVL